MTTTKRQRKMSYRSSVTVNFVCATEFCFDPPFFNGSSPRALSAQYSAHHTSRKSQLAGFHAHPFFRPVNDLRKCPLSLFILRIFSLFLIKTPSNKLLINLKRSFITGISDFSLGSLTPVLSVNKLLSFVCFPKIMESLNWLTKYVTDQRAELGVHVTGSLYTMWRPYIKMLSHLLGFLCQQLIVRRSTHVFSNRGLGLEKGEEFLQRSMCLMIALWPVGYFK